MFLALRFLLPGIVAEPYAVAEVTAARTVIDFKILLPRFRRPTMSCGRLSMTTPLALCDVERSHGGQGVPVPLDAADLLGAGSSLAERVEAHLQLEDYGEGVLEEDLFAAVLEEYDESHHIPSTEKL